MAGNVTKGVLGVIFTIGGVIRDKYVCEKQCWAHFIIIYKLSLLIIVNAVEWSRIVMNIMIKTVT